MSRAVLLSLLLALVAACGDDGAEPEDGAQRFPDVVAATATRAADGRLTFEVTISSPYDTPERYADGWRVLDPEGNVLGTHMLMHDHANEQPFTRSLSDVTIPEGVDVVVLQARDSEYGWALSTYEYELP